MNDSQFEQLINGISLIAAETHISNVLAELAACRIEPPRSYAFPGGVYALAVQFKDKIENWDKAPDFDFHEFYAKTFGEVPPQS